MALWKLLLPAIYGASASTDVELFHHTAITAEGLEIETVLEANTPTLCDSVKQRSGYLKAGGTRNEYFYWFFESRDKPKEDPFIMWLTENGPCKVKKDASGTTINEYSWNKNANIMWVDQPPGTGFSKGKEVTTEEEISQDMWAFLQNFAKQFPDYFNNGFYVIGESYGGHYVPNVMNYIWKQNNAGKGIHIPLKGFSVGNGLTDPYIQFAYYAQMAYNSSSAVNSQYDNIPISKVRYDAMTAAIPKCQEAIQECNKKETTNVCDSAYQTCLTSQVEPVSQTGVNPYNLNIKCEVPGLCYNFTAETTWLNNKTVQEQIGVDMKWESCDTLVNIRLESDWMKDYQEKVVGPIESGVRGLIYAGDLDFICNWLGNQAWSLALPWKGQKEFAGTSPVEWKVDGEAAGTIRQAKGLSNFTFVRVYGGGHMVPMDKPPAALQMVNQFITDTLKP